jgi:hypothetical protein
LETRDKRIESQTATIISLNEQLVEKSNYISDHLTGGKGHPIVFTNSIKATTPTTDETTTFTIKNETDLPLYDVTAVIFDWNYLKAKLTKSHNGMVPLLKQDDLARSIIYRFDANQMFENSSIISKDRFDLRDGLLYIKLKCRSSFVYEKMAFVIENRVIYQGFMIYEENGKILKEWITPGAPESAKIAIKRKLDLIPPQVEFTLTD